ncbi:hypothetical protein TNCV_159601 [Trichonephila clavipes]|uniref:Uncharacterized protein n=1 Tax=Trichonephila clavipes TaxID=2585209 RepID=A0A8X6R4U8_TRICX|nr:hypothetical protein TNCV_159601 [Trichonephila clavipes]
MYLQGEGTTQKINLVSRRCNNSTPLGYSSCPTGIVHGGTLNSRRAASPLVWLVDARGRKVGAPWLTPGFSPSKLGWNRAKSYCHLHGAQS